MHKRTFITMLSTCFPIVLFVWPLKDFLPPPGDDADTALSRYSCQGNKRRDRVRDVRPLADYYNQDIHIGSERLKNLFVGWRRTGFLFVVFVSSGVSVFF